MNGERKVVRAAEAVWTRTVACCVSVRAGGDSPAFAEVLDDDFNTPAAIAELHALKGDDPAAIVSGLELLGITRWGHRWKALEAATRLEPAVPQDVIDAGLLFAGDINLDY